jgi:polyisoprenoid-binding protein YceI/peroxiredoxin
MKRHYGAFLACVVLAGIAVQAQEKVFVIDPVHSGLGFRIRHLYSVFPGRLDSFSGTITCTTNDLTTTKVTGSVDVTSIYTGNPDRDKHLRSADFFNVASFPKASFESTRVTPGPDNTLVIRGRITLRDVTADITFTGKILGYGVDHKGANRVGYHGEGTLDRSAFGIVYNMTLPTGLTVLGSEVTLVLDMEAVEVDPAPAEEPKPLAAQLQEQKSAETKDLPPEAAAALEKARQEIASQQNVGGLRIGDKAPDFSLPDTADKLVSLSDTLKKGPVVLVFYRGEWCPFCNLQLHALETAYPDMRKLGATLLAVSPQKIDKAMVQQNKGALSFPLLSDVKGDCLRTYKLLYTIPPEMQKIYKERFGINLEEYNGPGRWELPVTATYVIDTDGTIAAGVVDLDYTKLMGPKDILAALKALRK